MPRHPRPRKGKAMTETDRDVLMTIQAAISVCAYFVGKGAGYHAAVLEYLRIRVGGRCEHAIPTCDFCNKKWRLR